MDPLADLNEPQRQAVMHIDGPLLVLAGAGSGKTRVITRRVAYLVQQGVAPWNILALTFTNKAAGEMKERVESQGVPRGATVTTFHSLCVRLLRDFGAEAGIDRNFTIYDRSDQIKMVKEATTRLDLPSDRLPPNSIHAAISNAKNQLITADKFAQQASDFFSKNVAKIYTKYEELLRAANALDFDDLLLKMALLMGQRPDLRQALSERYRYILIDEYQDTNRAQYVIAHGIAMDHENICATGDPDQSIYGWRGADIKNIMEFEADYPNAVVVRLEENYRSTEPILNAASHLIAHNKMRKDKTLWTRREGGSAVHIVVTDDQHGEAREVAQRIKAFHKAGRNFADMAVFYRVNSLSRVVEEELMKATVPYRIARGVEFYNRKEIKDLLAYLKLVANPADDLSCERIINTPTRGIGDTTGGKLQSFAINTGVPLLEACRRADQSGLPAATAKKVMAFGATIAGLASSLFVSVKDLMEQVVDRSGLGKSYAGKDEEDVQATANLAELVSTAEEFDKNSEGGTLADYLQQISLVSDVDHFEGGSGAVTLMTLHAAKGLEFPVVFVVGCEHGLLPFEREGEPPAGDKLEEERRLAFVGMTRAMEELILTRCRYRMFRGKTMPQSPSQFLSEIGTEGVEVEDATTSFSRAARNIEPAQRGRFYEEVGDRAAIEALEENASATFPPEYEFLQVGSKVRHAKFGLGRVLAIHQPWPQTRARVVFETLGEKTLVLAQAKLEVIG